MKQTYILINPHDETGNDDGVIDKKEMTANEAYYLNEQRYISGSGLRWVKAY